MSSPTSRTLERCRKLGWPCGVVERWIGPPNQPWMRKRVDLFGFIDLIALDGQRGALGIQACSTGDAARRVAKILIERHAEAMAWLKTGNRIEVWGWSKRGPKGKAKRWAVRVTVLTANDVDGIDVSEGEVRTLPKKTIVARAHKARTSKAKNQLELNTPELGEMFNIDIEEETT